MPDRFKATVERIYVCSKCGRSEKRVENIGSRDTASCKYCSSKEVKSQGKGIGFIRE